MAIQIETDERGAPHVAGTRGSHPLWRRTFRPFFLGVGVYGFVVVAPNSIQLFLLLVGGLLWAAAFGLFAILYAPILTHPRIDGKEG